MKSSLMAVVLLAFCGPVRAADDLLIADFEGKDYGTWRVEGEAFGPGPAGGTLPHQMEVSGYAGHGLANSFFKGDGTMGRLVSPEFKIERKNISFLIGGGGWPKLTCINLLVGTNVVRTATGPNTEPGGSEELAPASWDVSEFAGQVAHIEIVDAARGGWGHINVDQISQSDRAAPVIAKPTTREREILLERKFLLFPVQNGAKKAKKQLCSVLVDGQVVRKFDIEMSDAPGWFAHLDVGAWRGKKAVVRIEKIQEDSKAPDLVTQSDSLWHEDEIYREPLRGQFHFSSRRGWNNDPNGMVFADGEYHLYYQHNPYGWPWGNMHWGHAVSRDMIHWRELPVAIYPREYGDWVFSGSAVVDRNNTSGWKKGTNELIVAAFTSTARGECIVYSTDGGRTFAEFEGNPVVKHKGRDPRLLWHEQSKQWVMAVYDELEGGKFIAFYTSPDLKVWTFQSRISDFYECPDIFELSGKWVLTAASSDYMVGRFDGREFKPETPRLKGHRGHGFYAAQTFSHEPQGRVVQIGWFQTATPGMPFNQSMSVPNELRLVTTPDGPRLTWTPVKEFDSLRVNSHHIGNLKLNPGDANPLKDVSAELLDITATLKPSADSEVHFTVRGVVIGYDASKQELTVAGRTAPAVLNDGAMDLRILADRTGLEIYASRGLTFMPLAMNLHPDHRSLTLATDGASVDVVSLDVYELRSAWK